MITGHNENAVRCSFPASEAPHRAYPGIWLVSLSQGLQCDLGLMGFGDSPGEP